MNTNPQQILLWPHQQDVADQEYMVDGHSYNITRPYMEYFPVTGGNRGAVVILPGGGFAKLATLTEGRDIARWVNDQLHLSAFVVHYRLAEHGYPQPQRDARQALRRVRQHAQQWQLDVNNIGVCGFSIGGYLGAQLAVAPLLYQQTDEDLQTINARPNWGILGYPVTTMNHGIDHHPSTLAIFGHEPTLAEQQECDLPAHIDSHVPPLFIFHQQNDPSVPAIQSVQFMEALLPYQSCSELHIYQGNQHGFGLAAHDPGNAKDWPRQAQRWLALNQITS